MTQPEQSPTAGGPFLRNPGFLLALILIVAAAVRLLYLNQAAGYPNFQVPYAGLDAALYHNLGERVAEGDLLLGTEVYSYSPLYAYLVGGVYAIFGTGEWPIRLVNIAFGLLTVSLVFLLTRRLFGSVAAACVASLGSALYGPYLVFDASRLKTSLAQFLVALTLFLVVWAAEKPGRLGWVFPGIVLGLAVGLNGHLAFFLCGLCLWLLVRTTPDDENVRPEGFTRRGFVRLAAPAALLMGAALAVAPFSVRNLVVAEDLVLVSANGGIHLYTGNHEGAWGGYTRIEGVRPNPAGHAHDARLLAQREVGRSLKASEVSRFWKEKARAFASQNPEAYLSLLAKKARLIAGAYEIPNNENYQFLTRLSPYLGLFPGFGLLFPLGMCGLMISLRGWKGNRGLVIVYLFVFLTGLAIVLSFVAWRYRLPLTLALWSCAGFCVVSVFRWLQERRLVRLGLTAGLFCLCWLIAHSSPISAARTNRHLESAGKNMEACSYEAKLRQQIEGGGFKGGRGEPGLVWLRLAKLRRRQQDLEGAADVLREGLSLHPDDPRLWHTLANLLTRTGDVEGAREARERYWEARASRPPRRIPRRPKGP